MRLSDILTLPAAALPFYLRETINLIDGLHEFSLCAPFPLRIAGGRKEQGAYHFSERPYRPLMIAISRHATHAPLTLAHEVGHFIDHMVLNHLKRGFASDYDDAFAPLLQLWHESENVTLLGRILRESGKHASAASRSYLRYQLTPRELWARSYAQWVVARTGDAVLAAQLRELRDKGDYFAGRRCTFQWEDEPFKPIMRAVDKLLSEALP